MSQQQPQLSPYPPLILYPLGRGLRWRAVRLAYSGTTTHGTTKARTASLTLPGIGSAIELLLTVRVTRHHGNRRGSR